MALASLDDVRTHIPPDKFEVTDGNVEIQLYQTDVERVIKGYLSSVFSATTIAAWADPTSTPALIRACAGRLVAAFYYAKRLSEDIPDWDKTYPQRLYNDAIMLLEDIRIGQATLPEVTEVPGTQFDTSFFSPTSGDPKFSMEMRW